MNMKEMIENLIKSKDPNITINQNVLDEQAKIAESIYNEISSSSSGRLFLLRAPTGFGKTETFLAPYFYSVVNDSWFAGRVYIVDPIHALLEQMRRRIEDYARNFLANNVSDMRDYNLVGEDHGEVSNRTYLYTAPITLTTIDSFAYGYVAKRVMSWISRGIETGRYSMPAGLIMNAYNVFDEAHLIQDEAYIGPRVLSRIISSIVNSGGIVVFSTATIPSTLLRRFEERVKDNFVELPLPNLGERKIVKLHVENKTIDNLDIPENECNNSTLIIVNTIDKARKLYFKFKEKCKGNVTILHSLMRKSDRSKALDEVGKGKMLISTQAAEVGIDIKSFKRIYTEWAPLDSLIQRFGRVRRNDIEAYVFEVDNPFPYLNDIVEKTKKVLSGIGQEIDLNDVNTVTEHLDDIYTQDIIDSLLDKGDALYIESLEYLNNLHLYSYPPEQDITLRPSYYVTLYVVDDDKKCEEFTRNYLQNYQMKYSISKIDDKGVSRLVGLLQGVKKICKFKDGEFVELTENDDKSRLIKSLQKGLIEQVVKEILELIVKNENIYDEAGIKTELLKEIAREEKKRKTSGKKKSSSKKKKEEEE